MEIKNQREQLDLSLSKILTPSDEGVLRYWVGGVDGVLNKWETTPPRFPQIPASYMNGLPESADLTLYANPFLKGVLLRLSPPLWKRKTLLYNLWLSEEKTETEFIIYDSIHNPYRLDEMALSKNHKRAGEINQFWDMTKGNTLELAKPEDLVAFNILVDEVVKENYKLTFMNLV